MAITKIKFKQLESSTNTGSIIATNSSNIPAIVEATPGADFIWFYDDTDGSTKNLTVGTNLSITGTTLNASAGAGGYVTIQEEGSDLAAQSKLNFVGAGFTAADDAGNSRTNVTLDATLNALAAYNTNGILTQTAADTFTGRTITGTASRLSVTNGNGVSGNPTLDIDAAYVGQATITTLGTVSTGTWNATTIAANKGGTGQTSYAIGDLLTANTTSTLSKIAAVASGSVLKSAGTSTIPVWGTLASTDLSNSSSIVLTTGTQSISGTKTFSSNITLSATPSAGTDVTNVTYVTTAISNAIAGLRKGSVRVATLVNGTLASAFENGDTVDGITLVTGDLILIKNQSSTAENGVYTVNASGAPTRATWMDAANEIDGVYVAVEDGTQAGTLWITVSEVTTLNTDPIVFTQIQTAGTIGGSVAANKVAYGSGTNTLTTTTNFHFNGTQLAVGTDTPDTSTMVTTKGTGTGVGTYGIHHKNSSDATVFSVADNGTTIIGSSVTLTLGAAQITGTGALTISSGGSNPISINSSASGTTAINLDTSSGVGGSKVTTAAGNTNASFTIDGNTRTATNSLGIGIEIVGGYAPTSGGIGTFTGLKYTSTINQTGGHSGITRGLHILPTLTAAADFRGLEISAAGHFAIKTTAGKVQFDIGSDTSKDMYYKAASGELARIPLGSNGDVLTISSSVPTWTTPASATTVTRAYLTGSTSSVIDLDSGTAVTDIDGSNVAFTVPTDLEKTFVVRNGVTLSRSGSVSRDYTLVSATGVLTLATALESDESLMVYKID